MIALTGQRLNMGIKLSQNFQFLHTKIRGFVREVYHYFWGGENEFF